MNDNEILDSELQLRGTAIIKLDYLNSTFYDSACFMPFSLSTLSKNFKVETEKLTNFKLNGKNLSSMELCFYKPELNIYDFVELKDKEPEFWKCY